MPNLTFQTQNVDHFKTLQQGAYITVRFQNWILITVVYIQLEVNQVNNSADFHTHYFEITSTNNPRTLAALFYVYGACWLTDRSITASSRIPWRTVTPWTVSINLLNRTCRNRVWDTKLKTQGIVKGTGRTQSDAAFKCLEGFRECVNALKRTLGRPLTTWNEFLMLWCIF